MISINYDDESILTLFGIHERLQKIRDYNIQLDDVEYSKIINYLLDYTINDRNELDSVIIHWCLHLILQVTITFLFIRFSLLFLFFFLFIYSYLCVDQAQEISSVLETRNR